MRFGLRSKCAPSSRSSVSSNPSRHNPLYWLAVSISLFLVLFGSAATSSAASTFLVCASRSLNSQPGRAPRQRGASSNKRGLSGTKGTPRSGHKAPENCCLSGACVSISNAGQHVSEAAWVRPGRVRGLTSSLKRRPTTAATAWPLQAMSVIVLPRPSGVCLRGRLSSNVRPHTHSCPTHGDLQGSAYRFARLA